MRLLSYPLVNLLQMSRDLSRSPTGQGNTDQSGSDLEADGKEYLKASTVLDRQGSQ